MQQPLRNISNRTSLGPPSRREKRDDRRTTVGVRPSNRRSIAPTRPRAQSIHPSSSRRSTTTKPRRSSTLNRGGTTRVSDPRDLSSKEERIRAMKRILKYLNENGFNDFVVTKKELTSPTQKQFLCMLRFMVQQWDPSFEFGEKPAEDIPNLFKFCGYPSTISKSALLSCGSPHTWPTLLGALHWMVQLLEYLNATQDSEVPNTGDFSIHNTESKFFFEYLCKGYESFLNGEEEYTSEIEDDLQDKLRSRDNTILEDIQDLSDARDKLLQITEEMSTNPSPLEVLNKKKSDAENDIVKFRDYIGKLEEQHAGLHATTEECTQDLDEIAQEIKHKQAEKEELGGVVDAQEMSVEDVEKIHRERGLLEAALKSALSHKEITMESIEEREGVEHKLMDELERAVKLFNEKATDVGLIPSTGIYAQGKDYELILNPRGRTPDDILLNNVRDTIKPALIAQTNAVISLTDKKQEAKHQITEEVERNEEVVAERKYELESLESKVQRAQHAYKSEKESVQQQMRHKQTEADRIRKKTDRMASEVMDHFNKVKKIRDTCRQEEETLTILQENERTHFRDSIIESLTMLMDHKSFLQEQLGSLEVQWKSII